VPTQSDSAATDRLDVPGRGAEAERRRVLMLGASGDST